jgi:hypothetical protein
MKAVTAEEKFNTKDCKRTCLRFESAVRCKENVFTV